MANENKSDDIKVRLIKTERKLLEKKALEKEYFLGDPKKKKPNVSKYIRALITTDKNPAISEIDLQALRKDFANLSRLGSNLNQLVHHINERNLISKKDDGKALEPIKADELQSTKIQIIDIEQEVIKLQKTLMETLSKLKVD